MHKLKLLNVMHGMCIVSLLAACGQAPTAPNSSLRSMAEKGAMAIETDGENARILVNLTTDRDDVILCAGELANCTKQDGNEIQLKKTAAGYRRSEEAISLQHKLNLHVLAKESSGRKVIFSATLKNKNIPDLGQDSDLPAPTGLPAIRPVSGVNVAYDYHGALGRSSSTSAVVRMIIQSGKLKDSTTLTLTGTVLNLRNTKSSIPLNQDVVVSEGRAIDFTVKGLEPDTVYRIENISITDKNSVGSNEKVRDSYYLMTASDTKLAKAKRHVAFRAISESYDWDHGNYDSSEGYAFGGGWCDYFYSWAISDQFKIGAGGYSKALFSNQGMLRDSNAIHELGEKESLTGDYVRYEGTREGTHTFMILSYDTATKSLWTVEGNFNRRVMRNQRNVNSPWMHGHLSDSMLR